MSWEVLVTVFTFGGLGAVVRGAVIFILSVPSVFFFPFSVLMVNILAAFLGGFIMSMLLPGDINSALAIGMVGGLGTLSSFTGDVINHFFDRRHRNKVVSIALLYFVITSVAGVLAAQGGMSAGKLIVDYNQHQAEEFKNSLMGGTQALQQSILDTHDHDGEYDELLKHKDINIDDYKLSEEAKEAIRNAEARAAAAQAASAADTAAPAADANASAADAAAAAAPADAATDSTAK